MGMSAGRHASVYRYTRKLADLMNLAHFNVIVNQDYEGVVRGATVYAASEVGLDQACITIGYSESFFASSPENQRNTVCHELIHAHVDAMFQITCGSPTVKDQLGILAYSMFEEAGRSIMERAVDQMATGWSALLPLPPRFPK